MGWEMVEIEKLLEKEYDCKIKIINDVKAEIDTASFPANAIETPRESIDKITSWRGFAKSKSVIS